MGRQGEDRTGSPGEFPGVLRELRKRARLTQEQLAAAAGLSYRTVSDLERGLAATPQRETVRLLADALDLLGEERARFETAARGRPLEVVPQAAAAAAMRSLPRDVASFTGRARELEQLAKSVATAGGVVSIHAIGGMAGVGKTAFAVHAAHRLAGRFPAGQVFLPLHGHTPGRAPVDPADALASLLLAAGVPPGRVPPDREERAALWRDQVADRPLLLVLDDAAGSEQVRPLLPGGGGSLILVTSRRHLSALDDATAISLDTLPPDEAAALLVRLAGRAGLSPGDPGVREIAGLCGYLPLAIGMVARQLRHHPAWTVVGRAAELASARDRLAFMTTENLSVAVAFDLSYADLTPDQQRLFRRIGLHPGTDIDGYAAAALNGSSLGAARRGLEALYDRYLLTEPASGRYQPHDLIREHARVLAGRADTGEDADAALSRLLDYYQHTAAIANTWISRRTRPGPAATGPGPGAVPELADHAQTLAWARAERANLLACLDHATDAGQQARITGLTASISGLLKYDGPWADAAARHTTATTAARQLGDRLSEANALHDLGYLLHSTGDYPAAVRTQEKALGLYRDLDDRLGQAHALAHLGEVRALTSEYAAAVRAQEEALGIYRDLDDRLGQVNALCNLGAVRALTGEYPAAVRAQEEALSISRDLGDRLSQPNILSRLGIVRQLMGEYPAAARAQEEALSIARDLGNRLGQANSLCSLGTVRQLMGEYPAAVRAQEEALDLFRALDDRRGEANALCSLGAVLRLTGDYPAAAQAMDQALGIYDDLGDRGGAAEVLNERGTLHRLSGELVRAEGCHRRSLAMSRDMASSWDEAHALAGLGRCALAAGDAAQGGTLLRQALEVFQRIGAAEAPDVRAELDALAKAPPVPGELG